LSAFLFADISVLGHSFSRATVLAVLRGPIPKDLGEAVSDDS